MAAPKKPSSSAAKVKSLPKKAPKGSAAVKGGVLRTGGDDDLEDLEVERAK